jgi:hypothetical protein
MADEKQFEYGIGTPYGNGKAYHQPGWTYYAEKAETERRIQLQNAKLVLKEKRMKAGNTLLYVHCQTRQERKAISCDYRQH